MRALTASSCDFGVTALTRCGGCRRDGTSQTCFTLDIGVHEGEVGSLVDGITRALSWKPSGGSCDVCDTAAEAREILSSDLPRLLVIETSRIAAASQPCQLIPTPIRFVNQCDPNEKVDMSPALTLHYQGNRKDGHWWVATYSANGEIDLIISDDDVSSLQDSRYTAWDCATTWHIAIYRRTVSKGHWSQ